MTHYHTSKYSSIFILSKIHIIVWISIHQYSFSFTSWSKIWSIDMHASDNTWCEICLYSMASHGQTSRVCYVFTLMHRILQVFLWIHFRIRHLIDSTLFQMVLVSKLALSGIKHEALKSGTIFTFRLFRSLMVALHGYWTAACNGL